MQDIINQFIEAMVKAGCSPAKPDDIFADGKDHYTRLDGDKRDKRLGYCLNIESDGFAWGNFRNFKTGEHGKWHSKSGLKGLSAEEREDINQRIKDAEVKRDAEIATRHKEKATEAQKFWDSLPLADDTHPYLVRKKIKANGARIDGEDLIYIGYADTKIYTYQRILPDGTKLFLEGAKKQGTFYPFYTPTESKDIICIAEGIATATSIREATGFTVFAAWDASNLQLVARDMRKRYPNAKIIICGDNDQYGKKNTGKIAAEQAAKKVNGLVCIPEFEDKTEEPTDWNDYHQLYGLDAVRDKILGVLNAPRGDGSVHHSPDVDLQLPVTNNIPSWQPDDLVPFDAPTTIGNLSPIFDDKKLTRSLLWKTWPTEFKEGKLEPNYLHNILVFLRHKPKYQGLFRYDRFAGNIVLHREPWYHGDGPFMVRPINDADLGYIRASLEEDGLAPKKDNIREAVYIVACENWIDPPLEYFESLKWDGVERIPNWMKKYLGATGDEEYLSVIGNSMLVSIVARNYEPGCKCDTMVILEGKQGLKKSTALKVLATIGRGKSGISYFSDALTFGKIQEKDTVLITEGKLILEVPEMGGLGKKEINEVKAWLSTASDRIRRPYGHCVEDIKRRFIPAGTTNESQYFRDPTGNRRLFPVTCTKIDLRKLDEDKEQLFAEAVHRYKNCVKWWVDAEDPVLLTIEAEQHLRLEEDVWKHPIETFLHCKNSTTISEILDHFQIDISKRDKHQTNRISAILTIIGFKTGTRWDNILGKNVSCWKRKEKVVEAVDAVFEEIAF